MIYLIIFFNFHLINFFFFFLFTLLKDINDNRPDFDRPNIEVSVLENSTIGTQLATFHATDVDNGGKSKVTYYIDRASDRKRQFKINQDGVVSIQRKLDREIQPRHVLKIIGVDDGFPPKSSTATLTVVVGDINDNAPRFLYDYRPVVMEKSPPQKVQEILATDDDDRSKGNGPPFNFKVRKFTFLLFFLLIILFYIFNDFFYLKF